MKASVLSTDAGKGGGPAEEMDQVSFPVQSQEGILVNEVWYAQHGPKSQRVINIRLRNLFH